jgi:hypothetical protein
MTLENKRREAESEEKFAKKSAAWQPLRELALVTPYAMGYLSLMARRGQLKVKKIGRVWYSTLENVREFEKEMKKRKEERKKELSVKYREMSLPRRPMDNFQTQMANEIPRLQSRGVTSDGQALLRPFGATDEQASRKFQDNLDPRMSLRFSEDDKREKSAVGFRINVTSDSIFDEVQRELREVLDEIREKEKMIKKELTTENLQQTAENVAKVGNQLEVLEKERQETEDLSEKLVADLGKLLKTADEVQDQAEESVLDGTVEWVPVRNIGHGPESELAKKDFGIADPFYYTPTPSGAENQPRSKEQNRRHQSLEDNFLNIPYNAHPFEYRRRHHEESGSKKTNWLLLFLIALMVAVAGMLLTLVIFV